MKNKGKKITITVAIILALLVIGGGTAAIVLTNGSQTAEPAAQETVAIADTAAPLAAPDAIADTAADTQVEAEVPEVKAEAVEVPVTEEPAAKADSKPESSKETLPAVEQIIVPVAPTTEVEVVDEPTAEELEAARLEALTRDSIQWLKGQLGDNTSLVYKYFVSGNRLNTELNSLGANFGQKISDELRSNVAGHDADSVFAWLMVSHNSTKNAADNTYDIYWTNEDLAQIAAGETIDDVTKYETETDEYTEGSAEKEIETMPDGKKETFDAIDADSFIPDATVAEAPIAE